MFFHSNLHLRITFELESYSKALTLLPTIGAKLLTIDIACTLTELKFMKFFLGKNDNLLAYIIKYFIINYFSTLWYE